MRLSLRLIYLFTYNLLQFCGHTWILANMAARFLTFGRDALADTFFSVGVVMSLCQLLSILELFHIADGIEEGRLLPRFVQVMERNLLLFTIILLEEIQSKPVVCVQFFLWNVLDLLRYPSDFLCVMSTPSFGLLWTRYTLWIPIYLISVVTEGITVYEALLYFESDPPPIQLTEPVSTHVSFPVVLKAYLPVLVTGASVSVWQLLKERKQQLERLDRKFKRK